MIIRKNGKMVGELKEGLFRKKIIESKHLLHREGGVPCIDRAAWDEYGEDAIGIVVLTDKGRLFEVDTETFNSHKKVINFGWGEQYLLPKEYWEIHERAEHTLRAPLKVE